MGYQTIARDNWGAFFDMLSRMARGRWMQLEIVSQEFGDQIEEDWNLFDGVSYDEPNDTVWVHSTDIGHEIPFPEEVIVQEQGLTRTLIVRDRDTVQIIHFRDPVLLNGH